MISWWRVRWWQNSWWRGDRKVEQGRGHSVAIVLERFKMPVLGLKIVIWGLFGGRIFFKRDEDFVGGSQKCKPGFSFLSI